MADDSNAPLRARRRRAATQSVTLADVAAAAGVSAQTVSRAIRDHPDVSAETKQMVEETIHRIGYVPNLAASNLASNVSKLVATIVPSISTSVFADTVSSAAQILEPAGYQMVLGVTNYSQATEENLVRKLLGRKPDGVFLIGAEHTPTARRMLEASGVPIVETWDWTDAPLGSLVGFANDDAMHALTRDVLARGYRSPVFVGSSDPGDVRARERSDGFARAWAEAASDREVQAVDSTGLPLSLATGAALFDRARERFPDADVVMFATDILACGAVLHARREGVRIPDDIAVTGFGDFELSSAITPALSTVTIAADRLGVEAAQILLDQMTTGGDPRRIDIGYRVTLRETTH